MSESVGIRATDRIRQLAVIAATAFAIVAAVFSSGVLGDTSVDRLQGGALSEDATLLAPAGPAFSIWSLIYLLLIGYAIWQALPGQGPRQRQRALGWWVALTVLLNGLWLLAARLGTLALTVAVIVLLLVALAETFRRTTRIRPAGPADRILVDAVTGLHLGWVSLATAANIAAWLADAGVEVAAPEAWAVAVIAAVTVVGVAISRVTARWAPAFALTWGLAWLAVGRLAGDPPSVAVGVAGIAAATAVLIAAAWYRHRTVAAASQPPRTHP